jgi:hypothetical protein
MDSKAASDQLNRILTFFPRVDNRASVLFAVNSTILGILAARIDPTHLQDWQTLTLAAATVVLLIWSFAALYICAYPNTRGGAESHVYFASIAARTELHYVHGFCALDEEAWRRDLASQIWRNSQILCIKYQFLKQAMITTMLSMAPWVIFMSKTEFT